MANGRKRKGASKEAASTAGRVARNSSLVEKKKKRAAAVDAARQLKLTPVAEQLIRRVVNPHRNVKHFSFGVSYNITQCSMAAGATTNVFDIVPYMGRGLGDDEFIGNRVRLLRYTVHVYAQQEGTYNPIQTAGSKVPPGLRLRYMFLQPKEAPNRATFNGNIQNRFRNEFLEQDDAFREYNGSLTHWHDKHNPSISTVHHQVKKRMDFQIIHDQIETGPWMTRLANHKVTWVYKPARKILQFKPNTGGPQYPENFNPQLVVLPNRTDLPFADYSVSSPPGAMVNLAIVAELDYEDIE